MHSTGSPIPALCGTHRCVCELLSPCAQGLRTRAQPECFWEVPAALASALPCPTQPPPLRVSTTRALASGRMGGWEGVWGAALSPTLCPCSGGGECRGGGL